jgi:hypothetical protein
MDRVIYDVFIGIIVAMISMISKWQWPLIKSLFDKESRRQARQITGRWKAHEIFADGKEDEFAMELRCRGGEVTGTHYCDTGFDEAKEYQINGTYRDHILTFRWTPKSDATLESGTVTVRLVEDKKLEGRGLYVEPSDGKIYTSTFNATMKS